MIETVLMALTTRHLLLYCYHLINYHGSIESNFFIASSLSALYGTRYKKLSLVEQTQTPIWIRYYYDSFLFHQTFAWAYSCLYHCFSVKIRGSQVKLMRLEVGCHGGGLKSQKWAGRRLVAGTVDCFYFLDTASDSCVVITTYDTLMSITEHTSSTTYHFCHK